MSKGKIVLSTLLTSAILFGGMNAYASDTEKRMAFEQATITATQAIQTATSKVAGQAMEVDFKFKNGSSYYNVEVIQQNQGKAEKHEVIIDAKTGAILADNVENQLNKEHKTQVETKVSLEQAINTAIQKTGGKVKEADLKMKKGTARYVIESIKEGNEYKTVIDANSGEVINSALDD